MARSTENLRFVLLTIAIPTFLFGTFFLYLVIAIPAYLLIAYFAIFLIDRREASGKPTHPVPQPSERTGKLSERSKPQVESKRPAPTDIEPKSPVPADLHLERVARDIGVDVRNLQRWVDELRRKEAGEGRKQAMYKILANLESSEQMRKQELSVAA